MQPKRRIVDVSVERGPAELEFPTHIVPVQVGLPSWSSQSRGTIRLRIDMPAGPHPFFRFLLLTAVLFCVLMAVGNIAAGRPVLDTLTTFIVTSALPVVTLVAFLNPFARREVLVIDSRFVTLSRGDTIEGVWGRREFTDVRVNDATGGLFSRVTRGKAARPTIVWGSGIPGGAIDWSGATGVGLSRKTAERLVSSIEGFCAEHPAEEEFEYFYFGGVPLAR